jgi:hypothetical protein
MKKMVTALALVGTMIAGAVSAQTAGTDDDIAFADAMWAQMLELNLAGDGAIMGLPYQGGPPHGETLETFFVETEIMGETGLLVVKRNYGPVGVTADEVLADPAGNLGSVTVMFQRAEGYDAEHDDWFYAKYQPDGALDSAPSGMALAGAIGRDLSGGCIACHILAGGDDYLYTTDGFPRRTAAMQ